MTVPFTRSAIARMRQIARDGGGIGNVIAEFGWDLPRIRRVADLYQIDLPDGSNDGVTPPPAAGEDDCITVKVAMPRPLFARLMIEAAVLDLPPGVVAREILQCAFECASVASAFPQEQQERT